MSETDTFPARYTTRGDILHVIAVSMFPPTTESLRESLAASLTGEQLRDDMDSLIRDGWICAVPVGHGNGGWELSESGRAAWGAAWE